MPGKVGRFSLADSPRRFALIIFMLSMVNISKADTTTVINKIEEIAQQVSRQYCPDKRTTVWTVEIKFQDNVCYINGDTDQRQAIQSFNEKLLEALPAEKVQNRMKLLPDDTMDGNDFGIIINSVESLRSGPSVFKDMVTQTLRGLAVEILKNEEGCYLVKTDDGYLGWIEDDRMLIGGDSLKTAWQKTPKVVYDETEGTIYSKASLKSQPVADIVLGNRLKLLGKRGSWTEVELVDGRRGFVPSSQLIAESEYTMRIPDADKVIATAMSLLGRPYLWGGASVKACDCSGFTQTIYRRHGVLLARDANMQVKQGTAVDTTNLPEKFKTGDLLFFGADAHRITHVAIYLGNSEYIHCSAFVRINSLSPTAHNYDAFLRERLHAVRRIISD
ncbi:MAG: NlpC/P60 family protein [Candidatus Neomarinimicrobiota bacterium]|jgi:cell wall-associated NlpC family hydrolase